MDQIDIAVRLTGLPFSSNLQAEPLFHQELVVVASPLLIKKPNPSFTIEELQSFPLLHDAHNNWPMVLNSKEKLSGAKFNHTSLAKMPKAPINQSLAKKLLKVRTLNQG
ncbi:hypothetical protein MUS1_05895 [Marinomonas ushuaiensis DSM 15871]|uniref:Uncharacterized protein n=1 Tax=Marinomonas ushuaiensis DSM 15871 TaxID=1122207 RepID=X7E1C1_9GAMM|nr:hypothetical protein MUS1_05895 [Marinomonas ushuaiensis DSM 15871]